MKKFFLFAIAAMAVLSACTKIETVESTQQSPIVFSVMNHLQRTKAQDLPYTGTVYPTSVPFGSFAWWTNNEWTGAEGDQAYVFMNNERVSHSSESGQWAPSETYYWTKTGYITFASYSPYTAGNTASADGFAAVPTYSRTDGFLFTNYTIVDDTNIDLMYSDLAANCSKTTNVDGTLVLDGTTGETATDHNFSGVPTIFNHALCRINFAFRAIGHKNPNVDRIVIDVTDVDIKNIDNKGSFTQNASPRWATNHSTNRANYDFAPEEALSLTLIESTADNVASTTNYTSLGVSRILLPQTLLTTLDDENQPVAVATTTDQVLVIAYTIKMHYASAPAEESAEGYWATETVTSTVRLSNGNIASWSDNQNITYRISINPYATQTVTFDPAVVAWTDVYSADIELPENN